MSTSFTECKSWPFEEARKILNRIHSQKEDSKPYVLFETGYGPSGLPHIGTFGEVLRTSMVRHAFCQLSDMPTRLFAFSDDMDGLRKVPDNIPQKEMVAQHLGKPLTKVPDPFGKFESFGHHNNAMLRDFLDSFGFEYEFQSSTDWYASGRFDEALKKVFNYYEEIMAVMLPSLREERRQTYSPFLPICPRTGIVLQVKMEELKADSFTVVYKDPETGHFVESPITGGACKLQWKVDWGMRWMALGVDYEMSGKDLIDSVKYSSQICRILGGRSPENLTYELFLDDIGQKISKSKGNGLSIEEWLKYAPKESLSYYMFQAPKKAKRLYFDVIPKAVDEYITQVKNFKANFNADNPVYHIHKNQAPDLDLKGLSFAMLLNLASVCHAEDASILRGFTDKYVADLNDISSIFLDQLIGHVIDYYHDFIAPHKTYRQPTDVEKEAILDLKKSLIEMDKDVQTDQLQELVFNVGKRHHFENLRDWFSCLYEVLLGQKEGPRMGSFIALYGIDNTIQLIQEKVSS